MRRPILILGFFLVFTNPLQASSRVLPSKDMVSLKKGQCVLYHFWATWCHPCLKELPILLKWMAERKFIQPVVVDISSPFSQKQFSQKWVDQVLKPNYMTYLKPEGDAEAYVRSLDPNWKGMLPYSVLYHRGKKMQGWEGTLDFSTLEARLTVLCREKSKT
ncbi:MAG: hypothetical protein R3B54_17935 [Bdellovibrionota bacterium]